MKVSEKKISNVKNVRALSLQRAFEKWRARDKDKTIKVGDSKDRKVGRCRAEEWALWSCGYGRRFMSERSRVCIPAMVTRRAIYTLKIACTFEQTERPEWPIKKVITLVKRVQTF